jgi:hypothetical protein
MYATWLLAWAYSGLGETDRGNALTEEVLERARAVGSTDMQAMVLSGGRATRAIEEGRVGAAVSMLEEAYHINRVIGNRWRLTHIASRLAHALASLGAAAAATRLLSSGRALFEEIGGNPPSHLAREDEVTLALVRDKLSETEFAEAWEQGRKLTPEEAIELALAEPDSDA